MDDPRLAALARLSAVVDRLRAPDGCPWDRKQTLPSMAPHLLEEAYELVDGLGGGSDDVVRGEAGDLLMNLFLIARIAEDEGRFSMAEVAGEVTDKLVRRHPHVFGDAEAGDAGGALAQWEAVKQQERSTAPEDADRSVLAGVPRALPALLRAWRVGQKAAGVGFDWPDAEGPLAKIDEELAELRAELDDDGAAGDRAEAELGDLLFAVVNLARHLGVDPETSLRRTCERFERRFRRVEAELGDGLREAGLDEMERAWERAKQAERG
ncbi:MAG: nucleoside triphosphate pyrophosphohydrolase [Planctomycetota bacterium]